MGHDREAAWPDRTVTYKPEFLTRLADRRAALRNEIETVLGVQRIIVWEIGCGHGHFLVRYAQENPDKFCVGVDIISDRLERGGRKRDRAAIQNCRFLRTEAREFLNALPRDVELEEIWVLFPDPWPKARHNKNRLLKPPFFEALASKARAGARFYFRTDHEDYFSEVESFFEKGLIPTWRVDANASWPLEQETVFQARAPAYRSLIAVRTEYPARPVEVVAPGLPPPGAPTSSA